MPPQLKRKRFRPSNWWEVAPASDASSLNSATRERPVANHNKSAERLGEGQKPSGRHSTQDDERPRKRGRPSLVEVDANTIAEGEGRRNTGRSMKRAEPAEAVAEAATGKRKVGRGKQHVQSQALKSSAPRTELDKPRRGQNIQSSSGNVSGNKPSKGKKAVQGNKEVQVQRNSTEDPLQRKRGRPSRAEAESRGKQSTVEEPDVEKQNASRLPPVKSKRGRPSKTELEHRVEQPVLAPEPSQRLRASKPASQPKEKTDNRSARQQVLPEKHNKPAKLVNQQDEPSNTHEQYEAKDQTRNKRQHFEEPSKGDGGAPEKENKPTYQHLATIDHNVSKPTIEKNWAALTPACIERISQLCQSLLRPVVMHATDESKKLQASTAVEMFSRRLLNKLSKGIPFPQATRSHREDDFDFENILDHNRSLSTQLMPILHSNELLESELTKQKTLLEQDEEVLLRLETNARSEAARAKQDERKLHVLVQRQDPKYEHGVMRDDIGLDDSHKFERSIFDLQQDPELKSILDIANGHMESMQGNVSQIGGIVEAISKTKAAVQSTLFEHVDSIRYEEIILG